MMTETNLEETVNVIAEIWNKNYKGIHTLCLLGSDGYLYRHNNIKHLVSPFGQRLYYKIDLEESLIPVVLENAINVDWRSEECKKNYYKK